MISVQKRKATCSSSSSSSTISNDGSDQSGAGSQPKNSRKKTKLAANRSNGSGAKGSSIDRLVPIDGDSSGSSSGNQDESIWIFGLINNIEQLLSTFTAINNTSSPASKLSSVSGASTPSAPPSSLASSTAPSPPSSLEQPANCHPSQSSLTTTRNTSTCTSSPASSPSSSSSSSLSSSSSSASSSASASASCSVPSSGPCQPGAALGAQQVATGASLPRSPLSRQIKFHEYKGPPSSKRQQQAAKAQQQQQQQTKAQVTGAGPASSSSSALQVSNDAFRSSGDKTPATHCMRMVQQRQTGAISKPVSGASIQPAAPLPVAQQLQRRDQVTIVGQRGAIAGQLSPFSASIQQHGRLHNVGFQPNQISASVHSLAAVKSQAHIMQQQQLASARMQPSHLLSQQPIRVTSGAQYTAEPGLQTFYIKQEAALPTNERPSDGSALVLTPFIEQSAKQPSSLADQRQLRHQFEKQQQHHLQFSATADRQLEMRQMDCDYARPAIMNTNQQQPSNDLSVGGLMMIESECQEQQLCRQQAAHLIQVQGQQRPPLGPSTRHQPMSAPIQQREQQVHYATYATNANYAPATCFMAAPSTDHQQPIGFANDNQFGSNGDSYSSPTSQQMEEEELTASFGLNSEETDACEIEPSIGFVPGIDEFLFSEFIDLQDVPMNVNESDWLKKFLPPCSMG